MEEVGLSGSPAGQVHHSPQRLLCLLKLLKISGGRIKSKRPFWQLWWRSRRRTLERLNRWVTLWRALGFHSHPRLNRRVITSHTLKIRALFVRPNWLRNLLLFIEVGLLAHSRARSGGIGPETFFFFLDLKVETEIDFSS